MEQIIRNIKKIESIEAYHLQQADVVYNENVLLNAEQIFTEMDKIGLASCAVSEKIENNQRTFKSKIVYLTCELPRTNSKHMAYKFTTVTGEEYLIGLADGTWPSLTRSQTFPRSATGKAAVEVTIEWNSTYPPLKIVG